MCKISELNHHNTNSPGMTAIRFDDGLATTVYRGIPVLPTPVSPTPVLPTPISPTPVSPTLKC